MSSPKTEVKDCSHPISKQKFDKMFMNDNGVFGGQTLNIILECECGYLSHIYSYRGNVPKEYVKPNSGGHFSDHQRDEFGQQEVW